MPVLYPKQDRQGLEHHQLDQPKSQDQRHPQWPPPPGWRCGKSSSSRWSRLWVQRVSPYQTELPGSGSIKKSKVSCEDARVLTHTRAHTPLLNEQSQAASLFDFYHATSTVKIPHAQGNANDRKSIWPWHRPVALSLFLSFFLSLSLPVFFTKDKHVVEWLMGKLLNHRPITIITRQSVQRLHKHMATSKAPRMPRPRDFWVNAMASMSKLARKKST